MIEFFGLYELAILRFAHILAMVYWLGGEWAVFQTSYKVVDPALSVAECVRHLDTVFRIDVVSRILADKLKDELKRPVIIDNRAGAGGVPRQDVAQAHPVRNAGGLVALSGHPGGDWRGCHIIAGHGAVRGGRRAAVVCGQADRLRPQPDCGVGFAILPA